MQTLQRDTLKKMIDAHESFYLINVLDHDSFRRAHIPGSVNMPGTEEDFARQVEELVEDRDAKLVVYCSSFECSASTKAAQRLEAAGFTRVLDYEGGLRDWQEAGHPLERATPRRQA